MHRIIQYFFKILYSPLWLIIISLWCLNRGCEIATGSRRSMSINMLLKNLIQYWKYTKEK